MNAAEAIPQQHAARLLVAAVLGNEPEGALVELRHRRRGEPMRREFIAADQPLLAVRRARYLALTADVWLGAAPRRRRHGGVDAIERAWVLWTDVDGQAGVEALRAFRPAPSIVVRTGTGPNCHAWWGLREPLRPDHAQRANRRLAYRLGGDQRATDAARILRVPGTRSFKHEPPAPVECVHLDLAVYTAREIVGDLPDPPERLRPAPERERPVTALPSARSNDVLLTLSPREYVPALTGRQVGPDGKLTCPFHADGQESTASLHAYDEPERGWFCYSCGFGGSVYDLAAALWRIRPVGADFHRVRERLAAELLQGVGA